MLNILITEVRSLKEEVASIKTSVLNIEESVVSVEAKTEYLDSKIEFIGETIRSKKNLSMKHKTQIDFVNEQSESVPSESEKIMSFSDILTSSMECDMASFFNINRIDHEIPNETTLITKDDTNNDCVNFNTPSMEKARQSTPSMEKVRQRSTNKCA